jgi:hypothetical protein
VPTGFLDSQAELAQLVDRIAAALAEGVGPALATALTTLDTRVADLYGLTPEERELVWAEFPPVDV